MPTTATLDWHIVPQLLSSAQIAVIAGVPLLDPQLAFLACVRVTSDAVQVTSAYVRRRVVVNLVNPPFTPPPLGWALPSGLEARIALTSTSDLDVAAGTTGAQVAVVTYSDAAGNGFTESIPLSGKQPALSVGTNFHSISDITTTPAGTTVAQHQRGVIRAKTVVGQLYTPPSGVILTQTLVKNPSLPFYQMGVLQESFFQRYPTTRSQLAILSNWLTNALRAAVGPVEVVDPVLS